MEIVSSIVKDQLNRFIIEMGDFAMKKKTIIISGIAAVLVIGSVVFCFAVKGDSTQPAEVAQTVTEAVATPTIEIPEEVVEEPEVVEEVPKVEVAEEPEVVEETTEVEETSSEGSIVDVAETSEEVSEGTGVSTQKEEVSSEQVVEPKQEEVKPVETKPVEAQPQQTKTEPNVNQISTDEASQALIAQLKADGAIWGDTPSTSTAHGFESSGGASLNIIVE
mgnify:CR=1 FL=1